MSDKRVRNSDIKEALMNLLSSSTQEGNQFVTFSIGQEEYAINIEQIQEISAYRELTNLPNTPPYLKGILNLRGHVIPVMDPRIRFSLKEIVYDKYSVIIIFKSQNKIVGMIVDSVNDVLTIENNQIEETPDMALNVDTNFLSGVGQVGDKFVILLEVNKMFTLDEINKL